jgi:hypothetical protein
VIIQAVLSTCSISRATIFDILIENNGILKTSQIVDSLNTTNPTARRTMTELKATGLVTMHDVNPGEYNSEKEIHLKPEFEWFLSDKFKELREGRLKEKYPLSNTSTNTDTVRDEKSHLETEPFPYPFPCKTLKGENSFNQDITMFSCKYCEFQNTDRYVHTTQKATLDRI